MRQLLLSSRLKSKLLAAAVLLAISRVAASRQSQMPLQHQQRSSTSGNGARLCLVSPWVSPWVE